MNNENKKVGLYIKSCRERVGLTQSQLADLIGVTGSAVSRWESGEVDNIGRSKIIKLARVFRVDEMSILHGTDEYTPPTTIAAHADHDLTEEEQEKVREYIRFLEAQRK